MQQSLTEKDTRIDAAMAEAKAMAQEQGLDYGDRFYLQVKDRLHIFRKHFGLSYGIDTEMNIGSNNVAVTAKITGPNGIVVASGLSMFPLSKPAAVETCETFAIGRALSAFGLIGSEYASADEMSRVDKSSSKGHDGDKMSDKEREFREEVKKHIKPPKFFVPERNDPDELTKVYDQIDQINSIEDLSAYWSFMLEPMSWMGDEDLAEVRASFKDRRNQLER